MKKPVVIACVAALAGGLATGYTAVACSGQSGSAQTQHNSKHGLHGKIVSVNSTGMVVETFGKNKESKQVNVTFASNVQVTLNGTASAVGQLARGDLVVVQGPVGDATAVRARSPGEKAAHSGKKGAPNA